MSDDPGQPAAAPARPGSAGPRLGPLRGLLPFIRPYWPRVLLALVFLAAAAASTLALPAAVRQLVDQGLHTSADADLATRLAGVRFYFGLIFAVAVSMAIFTAARFYTVSWIGERVTADLRRAVYAHVLDQSPQFFESIKTGEILSRLTTDTSVIQGAVGSSLSMGLRSMVLAIGAMSVLIATSPRLMLTVLGVIVLVVLPSMGIGRRVRRLSRASQDRIADTSGIAGEVLNAMPVVQSFHQQAREASRFASANESAFSTALRRIGTRAMFTAFLITGVFGSLLYGLYGGVTGVLQGAITAGQLSQTSLYIMLVASSVAMLAEVWGDLLRAAGATERLMELLQTHSPIREPDAPRELPRTGAAQGLAVRFGQVGFCYPSRPQVRVLDSLDLEIAAGSTVALVGPSGAGKSTLFQLLQRFYDVSAGSVTLDGIDVRTLSLASLRGSIAVVPQEATIFSGSIRDNILYGRPGASEAQLLAAAADAHVDGFVARLPDGYDTVLGERGLRLSGGQRQRIAIARAILKDAPLLLLDEATSSLDAQSEQVVQQALQRAMQGRTTIVIAHRLATVQRADCLYVLDHGRIVEQGRHDELIAQGRLYAGLAALQFTA